MCVVCNVCVYVCILSHSTLRMFLLGMILFEMLLLLLLIFPSFDGKYLL